MSSDTNGWNRVVNPLSVNGSHCPGPHTFLNKVRRIVWYGVWLLFYRPSPRPFHGWRRFLLRLLGARIGLGVHPYPSAKIWAPWNLEMGDHSCLGDNVDCYSVDTIKIGPHSTVSQYSFLCTASHDYTDPSMPLITSPIIIGEHAWIAADVFVGPGVTIGNGAVVGARSSVFRNIEPWAVVAGNPARLIRKRESLNLL
jgi:putative colanic acid biosynthesis acetyltransferase WcaF